MATAERVLALKLIGDVSDINKGLKGVSGNYKRMSTEATKWGKAIVGGLVIDGIDKVTASLGDAWAGFRSGQKVAAQLGNTWKRLGLDGTKLDSTLQKVTDSTLRLGTSDDEAVQAFNNSLLRTRDYEESLRRLTIAQDLVANGSAPNLSAAMKMIDKAATGSKLVVDKFGLTAKSADGRVRQLGNAVAGAAAKAARLDPWRVFTNKVGEGWEGLIGSLAKGDVKGSLAALSGIGDAVSRAVSGYDREITKRVGKKGHRRKVVVGVEHVEGFANQLSAVVDSLRKGIEDLAGTVDLAKVFSFDSLVGDARTAIQLLQTNTDLAGTIAIAALALGAAFSASMFLASVFVTAATAVFALPKWVVLTAADGAVAAVGKALGITFRFAMFVASKFVETAGIAVGAMTGSKGWGSVVSAAKDAGAILGGAMQLGLLGGLSFILSDLISNIIKNAGSGIPTGPADFQNWLNQARNRHAAGTSNAPGGWSWVGERGPELVNLRRGSTVLNARQSMAATSGGGSITVNINGLVTDPVQTGRAVVDAIRQYEKRASANWRR